LVLGLAWSAPARADDEAPAPAGPPPRLVGRLIGAQSSAKVRAGLWYANLSRGLFSFMARSEVVGPPDSAVGRGTGFITELGFQLTLGDYDFAVSALTDELIAPANDALSEIDNPVARTVLRQLLGELKSRALDQLVGTEVGLGLRYGNFKGVFDGTKFGFRDNQVYLGGRVEPWSSYYLSAQLQARMGSYMDWLFVRYSRFSKPQAFEITGVDPPGLQTAHVNAVGLGARWERVNDRDSGLFNFEYDFSLIPLTGLAVVSYGDWGSLVGVLFEMEASITGTLNIELDDWVALKPYVGFRADMISPIGGAFGGLTSSLSEQDPNEVQFLLPDYLIWGPIAGLEVIL
jgi:hypothetical protein